MEALAHISVSHSSLSCPRSPLATTTDRKPNAPVLLYIHGGGWVTGHKQFHSIPLIYQVAKAGWLVVTINYRLCSMPGVRIVPEQLSDCKRGASFQPIRERHRHQYRRRHLRRLIHSSLVQLLLGFARMRTALEPMVHSSSWRARVPVATWLRYSPCPRTSPNTSRASRMSIPT